MKNRKISEERICALHVKITEKCMKKLKYCVVTLDMTIQDFVSECIEKEIDKQVKKKSIDTQ